MAISAAPPSSPMDEINMTPLIDVMLVLLVMFIITIPLQTHAVKLDLPKACPSCPDVNEVKNRVVVTNGGAILWNGTPVNRDQLAFNLAASTRKSPQPELHLQPESEARYEIVNEVFVVARSAGVTRMGFVGTRLTEASDGIARWGLEQARCGRHQQPWLPVLSSARPASSTLHLATMERLPGLQAG